MGLIANLIFSDSEELSPIITIDGNFSHVNPPLAFEEKMRGQCFWSFNEENKDLYFSFGSPKYGEKLCSHILDGKPIDSNKSIYWESSFGMFKMRSYGEGADPSYLKPVGWHQGIFLMKHDGLFEEYEVLITKEREAECRENHNIVYEAIEIIRKKQELMHSGQILSPEKKRHFWKPYIIINLILLALIGLSFFLINITFKYDILCVLTMFLCPLAIIIISILAIDKYIFFKARARADFFDEI